MLNELLGRHQKLESGLDGDEVIGCDGSPPSGEQLAHHMLRDILQGRKHELLSGIGINHQDHIINNNNNEIKVDVEDASATMQDCLMDAAGSTGAIDRHRNLMEEGVNGIETDSLPSPKLEPQSPAKPEDAKKARVENIVSVMRSSPAPPQVNGCKKRKLYQPQQHDSNADRYIDDEEEEEPLRLKQVEKNALKYQLRSMQEQLAEMQQKYVQLCTRMEQSSDDSREVEEIPSDSEQSKRSPVVSPALTPNNQQQTAPITAPTLAQQINKLKISPTATHFHNGLLHDHHLSNAAAMYLGVSQKFLLEQEARIAKEAAATAAASAAAAAAAAASAETTNNTQSQPQQSKPSENIAERLNMIKNNMTPTGSDLEGLADALKTEITASLSNLIDSIVTRFVHQRKFRTNDAAAAAEQLNKDLLMASQFLERKSPKTKIPERPQAPLPTTSNPLVNGNINYPPHPLMASHHINNHIKNSEIPGLRPPMFQPPKPPSINHVPLYGMNHPFCITKQQQQQQECEQNEALSLVVTPKKKRHKVTDTRITPRTVSRILGQDGMGMSPASMDHPSSCTSPRLPHYPQPPPPMLPVSLPTSVAIPNPGLHESQVFHRTALFFHGPSHGHHMAMQTPSSPPRMHKIERDSPPLHHPATLIHPALLAAAQHGGSPDYGHIRAPSGSLNMDNDRNSDCNSGGDMSYDGMQPAPDVSLTSEHSSTLTPMHLRKAKLMFFWVRYPSSAVLKMYFPDIKFNKNNTAQLVKWFSNFREFYYIQMEKYARQAVSEGVKNSDDLHVGGDSELYRVLNLHYNRNNHIEVWGSQVPTSFRFVVEQTLREFFKAIQEGRDQEQSWKNQSIR